MNQEGSEIRQATAQDGNAILIPGQNFGPHLVVRILPPLAARSATRNGMSLARTN